MQQKVIDYILIYDLLRAQKIVLLFQRMTYLSKILESKSSTAWKISSPETVELV